MIKIETEIEIMMEIDWEAHTRADWGTAVQGNSALQVGLKRMLLDEVAVASDQVAA